MAGGNKQYFHIAAATGGTAISSNPGAILGSFAINTVAAAATSSVLTIYDSNATIGTGAGSRIIAVVNVQNGNVPGFDYNVTCALGIFYTYVQAGAVTAVGDFTITYQ